MDNTNLKSFLMILCKLIQPWSPELYFVVGNKPWLNFCIFYNYDKVYIHLALWNFLFQTILLY